MTNPTKNKSFLQKLLYAIEKNNSILCLGLDPEEGKISAEKKGNEPGEWILPWCLDLVGKTKDLICCVKPNIAFFEQYGAKGIEILQEVIRKIPYEIPVLLDAKRGDIGSTANAYVKAIYDVLQVDAVTLSPYLGKDSLEPFLAREGKMAFILCKTSNPSADEIQNLGLEPLYQVIAHKALTWGTSDQIGFVVGATQPDSLKAIRKLAPENWILAPGVGAQGGDLEKALGSGLRKDGLGMIIPVSRSIIFADDPRKAALELRDQINQIRTNLTSKKENQDDPASELVLELFKAESIRFGDFILASGKKSPIYIDLRRSISYPSLMKKIVQAYIEKIKDIKFDLLAGVPYAALPAAANIAFVMETAMIYPRKEVKTHGTGQAIEGNFKPGQTALLIEDVITTGGSIITASETLTSAGVNVKDAIVLVDRQQGGEEALSKLGVQLHAILNIRQVMDILMKNHRIDNSMYEKVMQYLDGEHAG